MSLNHLLQLMNSPPRRKIQYSKCYKPVQHKSSLLTELTLLLPQWTGQQVELCRPIEMRNSQDVTNYVLADEKAIILIEYHQWNIQLWADCVAVVVDLELSGFCPLANGTTCTLEGILLYMWCWGGGLKRNGNSRV